MDQPDLTARGLLRRSVELLRQHPLALLLPPLAIALLTGGSNQRGSAPSWDQWRDPTSIDLLGALPFYALVATVVTVILVVVLLAAIFLTLVVIATAVTYTATTRALLAHLTTGAAPDWVAAFHGVRGRWARLGWTYLLACLFVLVGLIALVVPGVIALAGILPLFAVLAAESATGPDALRRAWAISRGHKGQLALLVLGGVLLQILVGATLAWIPVLGWAFAVAATGGVTAVWLASGALLYHAANAPAIPAPPPAPAHLPAA